MAGYSYRTLTPKRSSLARVASTTFATPYQYAIPQGNPVDMIQQFKAQNPAPTFAADTSQAPNFGQAPSASLAAAAAPAAVSNVNGLTVDYSNDPILKDVQAQITAQDRQAEAAATAARNTNFIRLGSGALARAAGADQATIDAADQNQFGTMQELGRWNDRALGNVDSARNAQNLYYSTTRQRDRGLQQEDYLRQQNTATNTLQDTLTQIAQGLLAEKQQSQMSLLSAEEAAYQRALAAAQAAAAAPTAPTTSPAVAAQQQANNVYQIANNVQAGQVDPSMLDPYIDPNTAAGRYAQSVAAQARALQGVRENPSYLSQFAAPR